VPACLIVSGDRREEGGTSMADPIPAPTPPPPAAGAPTTGAPRKVRSPAAVIIFSIITLGIYFVVWIYKVFKELKENTGDGAGPTVALVIALLGYVSGIFIIVLLFLLPSEVGNMYAKAGLEKPVRGVTGFWNLIPIVGFIIWVVKVQHALNARWETLGPTP
jgi:Domain of unknown function (DUF4234)